MNMVNFLDGLDGLAAGVCAISGATFCVIELSLGRDRRRHPGRDRLRRLPRLPAPQLLSGADLHGRLGRAAARLHARGAIAVQGLLKTAALATLVLPLLVLAVPVLDTSFVVAKRIKNGQPIYVADARHLHHRFMRIGFSQRRAVVYLYAWCVTLALAALATRFVPPHPHGRLERDEPRDRRRWPACVAIASRSTSSTCSRSSSWRARGPAAANKLPAPPERRDGGVPAGGAVHAAARVGGERGEVEMRDVGARPAPAGASEDELVVQLRGAAVDAAGWQERDVPFADELP